MKKERDVSKILSERLGEGSLSSARGFSLVAVLASIGVFASVVLAYLLMVNLFFLGMRNINTNNDISNAMVRVASVFGDDDRFCNAVLGGKLLDPKDIHGIQVPSIEFHDLDGNVQNVPPVLRIGLPVNKDPGFKLAAVNDPGLLTSDIRLKPVTGLDPLRNTLVANLEVTFSRTGGGTAQAVRGLPIYALLDSSKRVLKCSTSATFFVLNEQYCQTGADGYQHVELAPSTNKFTCVDNKNVQYFSANGIDRKVSCGSGYRAAISPKNIHNSSVVSKVCKASSNGTNLPVRAYTNVGPDSSPVPIYDATLFYDPTSKLSTCTYEIDVDPAVFASYTYHIRCVSL